MLNVLRFLATTVRFDLAAALQEWNGFDHIQCQSAKAGAVELVIQGLVTANASENAPDRYRLRLARHGKSISRQEEFTFKRRGGRGRRITVSGDRVTIYENEQETFSRSLASNQTTGLATLPKLSESPLEQGGSGARIRRERERLAEHHALADRRQCVARRPRPVPPPPSITDPRMVTLAASIV